MYIVSTCKLLYRYWLHERVTRDIVTPRKPLWNEAKPRLTLVFEGGQFPMLPSCADNIYYIILNVIWIHHLHYVWYQNNPGQVKICVCISYSIYSNAHTTPVRIFGEPYTHKFCAVDIFWNITRCLVPSHVKAWFHDSAGDINFLSNIFQPIRFNYLTWKYYIKTYMLQVIFCTSYLYCSVIICSYFFFKMLKCDNSWYKILHCLHWFWFCMRYMLNFNL